jgi:hypothetical protein
VDAVTTSAERQVDALVFVALAQHPIGNAGLDEQPDAVALQDAGANGLLDLQPGAGVHDDRVDAVERQQMRQHEAGRAATHDAHLGRCDLWCHANPSRRVGAVVRPADTTGTPRTIPADLGVVVALMSVP